MVKAEVPILIFLVETKANTAHMSKIQTKLDYTQGIIVPSDEKNGGLALLWKEGTTIWTHKYSNSHIDIIIPNSVTGQHWKAMGFYGHPNTHKRHTSWKLLEYIYMHSLNSLRLFLGTSMRLLTLMKNVDGQRGVLIK